MYRSSSLIQRSPQAHSFNPDYLLQSMRSTYQDCSSFVGIKVIGFTCCLCSKGRWSAGQFSFPQSSLHDVQHLLDAYPSLPTRASFALPIHVFVFLALSLPLSGLVNCSSWSIAVERNRLFHPAWGSSCLVFSWC